MQQILEDRTLLGTLDEELRKQLMMVAGRMSRPFRLELTKLGKQYRRKQKRKNRVKDRESVSTTAIREARLNEVYVAPSQNLLPAGEAIRELTKSRPCYVCKTHFT